jgi:hypothetical protein
VKRVRLSCGHELLESEILSAAARISVSRRETFGAGSGRKPVPTPCPRCGAECPSAREARLHKCG